MAIKRSRLYSTLWESCNALRGSMDASQYKDYVLMILFVKYLSDKARQVTGFVSQPLKKDNSKKRLREFYFPGRLWSNW